MGFKLADEQASPSRWLRSEGNERLETNTQRVTLVDDTIRRPRDAGAEVVEALLVHLENASWPHAPRFLGVDDEDRQILTYVVGETYRQPPWQMDDPANAKRLGEIAALLRSLHSVTSTFEPPVGYSPKRHLPLAGTTWTHGDPGYSNVVYADGAMVGLIDWEFAGPADPLCDLAALLAVSVRGPRPDADDNPRRVRATHLAVEAIAQNYGLTDDQITRLPAAAALVLEDTARHWLTTDASRHEIERLLWRAEWFRTCDGV